MPSRDLLDRMQINPSADIPIYAQIRDGLREEIDAGRLGPGHELPSVRAIAQQYGISTKTVMQALKDLTGQGIITTRRGRPGRVATRRAPSTEVVFCINPHLMTHERQATFFHQLVDGLEEGYNESARRFWMTVAPEAQRTSADEILGVCAVRRSDGLVVYEPNGAMASLFRHVAERVPVCSLFTAIGGPADCITVDPVAGVRALLLERLAQGKRAFAYVGVPRYAHNSAREPSPYSLIYDELMRILDEAGVPCATHIRPMAAWTRADYAATVSGLPEGTVLVAGHPYILADVDIWGRGLDVISYTESSQTLERFRGTMDILYAGLHTLGRTAASLLRQRAKDRTRSGRNERVVPEIFRAQPPAGRGG